MLGVPSILLYCLLRTRGEFFLLNRQSKSQKKNKKNKSQNLTHPTAYLNDSPVIGSSSQKYLGISLYEKLNFLHHIKKKTFKANKGINVIKKLNISYSL